MARFHGAIGFATTTNPSPGVFQESIEERTYFGDVVRGSSKLGEGEPINSDISVVNTISIVGDDHAFSHFLAIRYISWMGVLWKISTIELQRPRLLLRLGGVYNGEQA